MMYTVEITTTSVNEDWSVHRRVLDTVPGTILIEDHEEPMLIVPVEADDALAAARFVDGVCKLMDLKVATGHIYETPECDFDVPEDDEPAAQTQVVSAVRDWMSESPDIRHRVDHSGRVLA